MKLSTSQKPCRILLSCTELSPITPSAGVETRNISYKFSLTPASCQVPPRSMPTMPTTSKDLQDPWCVCVGTGWVGRGQQEHVSQGAGLCPKLRHRGHWMETAQKKHHWEANMVKWLIEFLICSKDSPSGFHSTWTHGFCTIIFKGVLKMHFSNTAWFFRQGNTFCIQPNRSGIQKCPLHTVTYFIATLTERHLKENTPKHQQVL